MIARVAMSAHGFVALGFLVTSTVHSQPDNETPRAEMPNLFAKVAEVRYSTDPSINAFVDRKIDRFLGSAWFKEGIEPQYYMGSPVNSSSFLSWSHVTVRGLLSGFKRDGDVLVRPDGAPQKIIANVTLGPWNNLSLSGQYLTIARIAGFIEGTMENVDVSLLMRGDHVNTPLFTLTLEDVKVSIRGPVQITQFTGFWWFSNPMRLIANMVLPRMSQVMAVPIESKLKESIRAFLDHPQTRALLKS